MNTSIIEDSLAIDDLAPGADDGVLRGRCGHRAAVVALAGGREAGEGEYFALLLTSILGMVVLVAAQNLVVLFLGFELLSIPLYVLCATHMRREQSLESGLKYLIIGSVGSATLLYGMAFLYGATGSTDYVGIAEEATEDVLMFTGTWWWRGWRSRRRWRRSTSGRRTSTRARRPQSRRSWRWRPRRRRSGCCCGCSTWR